MNGQIKRIYQSFGFAVKGLWHCIKSERNMRIHIVLFAYVLYFSDFFALTPAELALIVLTGGLVLVCELVNTAIEVIVDLKSPSYDPLARMAKDIAAGAVLVSALSAAAVGFCLLWRPEVFYEIINTFLNNPIFFLPLSFSLIASAVFIYAIPKHKK